METNTTQEIASIKDRFMALVLNYIIYGGIFFVSIVLSYWTVAMVDFLSSGMGLRFSGDITIILMVGSLVFITVHYSQIRQSSSRNFGERIMNLSMVPLKTEKITCFMAFLRLFYFFSILLEFYSLLYFIADKKRTFLDVRCQAITVKVFRPSGGGEVTH